MKKTNYLRIFGFAILSFCFIFIGLPANLAYAQSASCLNWVLVKNLGGVVKYDPAIMASSDRLIVTGVGTNNALFANEYVIATGASGWYTLNGVLYSGTRMTADSNTIKVSVVGGGNAIFYRQYQSPGVWSDWHNDGIAALGDIGPSQANLNGISYRTIRTASNTVEIDKCADVCSTGAVSGCRVCKSDGSGWADDNSKCTGVQTCQNGVCVVGCTNQCLASGVKQCNGNGFQVCGNYDSDSCLEWSPVTNCAKGQFCSNGLCVEKARVVAACNQDWCNVAGIQSFQILRNPTGDNPKYYMFFESSNQDEGHWSAGGIGLATSNNLVDWSLSKNNPVITHKYGAWDPTVLYEDGIWKCWNSQSDAEKTGWHTAYFTTTNNPPDSGWSEHPESPVISTGSYYENSIVKDKGIYYLYRSEGSRKQSTDGIHFADAGTHNIPDRLGDVYKEGDVWYAFSSAPSGQYPDDDGVYVDLYESSDGLNFAKIKRVVDKSDFSFLNGPSDGAVVHNASNNYLDSETGDSMVFFHAGDTEWGTVGHPSNRKLYMLKGNSICISHASKKCDSGNLYWYNFCNIQEELAQNCGVDTPTNNYQCSGAWIQRQITKNGCANNACYSNTEWNNTTDCSATSQVCSSGQCAGSCTPNCTGKVCGDDGCGGSCGTCNANKTCNNGQCISSGGGGGGSGNQPPHKLTRAQILQRIAQIKQLLIQLIIQLIAELQKQLAASGK